MNGSTSIGGYVRGSGRRGAHPPWRPGSWLLAPLTVSVVLMAGGCHRSDARPAAKRSTQAAPAAAYDQAVTDTARVLAGLKPEERARLARWTASAAWRAHQSEFDRDWSRLDRERLSAMRAWRDREFPALAESCDTLLYPFAGPDFLNAYVLYPGCQRYLLFGLEPVGSVPVLEGLTDNRIDAVLAQLRESLSDVFVRDYFITRTMMSELRSPELDGTLPLLLTFLARLDARVVGIEMDGPWNPAPQATPSALPSAGGAEQEAVRPRRLSGATVRFVRAGSAHVQTLSYIRVQLQDAEFAKQERLLSYLDGLGPFTTMVKSASYLMHDNRFSRIRSLILARSGSVLQDDTGVPYRFFSSSAWNLTLFGRYTPPVKDFNYGLQKDLAAAYQQSSAVKDLPFTFGYHWRQGASSVMLAVRKPEAR
jgi:hypothetical protein